MNRIIFHIDVNSALLSWEAAKRVKNGEEDIRKLASCIGGDPNTRRGVVLAKSSESKKFGVKTGEPLSFSLRKCPHLQIFKPNFKLYSSCSKASAKSKKMFLSLNLRNGQTQEKSWEITFHSPGECLILGVIILIFGV